MQTFKVKVNSNAKTEALTETGHGTFTVRVQEPPEKGKANKAVLRVVAKHLGVPAARVYIKRGTTSREKIIGIKE